MQAWRWKKNSKPGDAGWKLRKADRFSGDTVSCALGDIADVSASGMRVICQGKPPVSVGGTVPLRLKFGDGSLKLKAQVRWCKRKGIKTHEIGLKFIDLKPGMPKVLEAIARFGMASAAKGMDDDYVTGREPGSTSQNTSAKQEQQNQQQEQPVPTVEAVLPNYYEALGLKPDASEGQVKAAYRRLAVAWHPDHNNAPDAMARFEAINEAYHVLSDHQRRANYQRAAG